MGTSSFTYVDGRDPWERQKGEPGEQHDWFRHWLNDAHRRSYVRTGEKFEVAAHAVRRAAERNRWTERLAAWKAHNSAQIQERYNDLAEQGLVPFAQGFARLAAWAVQAPLEGVPPDRALAVATGALRLITEPSVRDLIRIAAAGQSREFDALDLVLDRLAAEFPDAHDAALDALEDAATAPAEAGAGDPGSG